MDYFFICLFGVYGLMIGSFLNVCIYRLPEKKNITTDRSHCPNCDHILAPKDLIPVFSYLFLKRQCRYCQKKISPRYAVIEILTMLLFSGSALLFSPHTINSDFAKALLFTAYSSSLLVWVMIRYDQKNPPYGIYIWLLIPAFILANLQLNQFLPLIIKIVIITILSIFILLFEKFPSIIQSLKGETVVLIISAMIIPWFIIIALIIILYLAFIITSKTNKTTRFSLKPELFIPFYVGFSTVFIFYIQNI